MLVSLCHTLPISFLTISDGFSHSVFVQQAPTHLSPTSNSDGRTQAPSPPPPLQDLIYLRESARMRQQVEGQSARMCQQVEWQNGQERTSRLHPDCRAQLRARVRHSTEPRGRPEPKSLLTVYSVSTQHQWVSLTCILFI